MSLSCHSMAAAAARSAARSTCRGPEKFVRRVDLLTGTQRVGSAPRRSPAPTPPSPPARSP
eukprot:2181666-Pleurochrysis_carterae.AAC.1